MTEDDRRASWLGQARAHLRQADPVLARLIDERPDFDPRAWLTQLPPMDLFGALLFQVAGQQLSVAATRTILGRIEARFGGRLPAPAELLDLPPAELRAAGLSWRKIATSRCAKRFRPPTSSTTGPARRRSWTSPRSGGPTGAWPPATCSRPSSNQPGR
jgi:3-methyladenine DNA glycosylase/8-oxoguanine DNA glycosylase